MKSQSTFKNHPPLSAEALQLLLGSLLADGYMDWRSRYGRFMVRHGGKQAKYCDWKARLLKPYVKTPPRNAVNAGYGRTCRVFNTVTSPVFETIRDLCYKRKDNADGNPVRWMKRINERWLSQLEWPGIAVWFADDGTLARSTGACRVAIFNTHGNCRADVQLMANRLCQLGLDARVRNVAGGHHLIYLSARSTREFVDKIRRFTPRAMRYKLRVPRLRLPCCAFCGQQITEPIANLNPKRPCCPRPECRRLRNRERNQRYASKPDKRKLKRAVSKLRRSTMSAAQKAAIYHRQRERFKDSAYRERANALKRAWRKKRREAGLPRM